MGLRAPGTEQVAAPVTATKGRDFDAEARGKTRCSMFSAALQSQVLAQYLYAKEVSFDELIELVSKVAEKGVAYTFGD